MHQQRPSWSLLYAIVAVLVAVLAVIEADVGEGTLKDRRILRDEGFISVTLAVDSVTGKIAGGPDISARGFTDDRDAFEPVRRLIEDELDRAAAEGVADAHTLAQAVRRIVGRWVNDTYRRRPMIVPVVIST